MVIQAAGQDPGGVGDVADGRRAHSAIGEEPRRDLEQLVAAPGLAV